MLPPILASLLLLRLRVGLLCVWSRKIERESRKWGLGMMVVEGTADLSFSTLTHIWVFWGLDYFPCNKIEEREYEQVIITFDFG